MSVCNVMEIYCYGPFYKYGNKYIDTVWKYIALERNMKSLQCEHIALIFTPYVVANQNKQLLPHSYHAIFSTEVARSIIAPPGDILPNPNPTTFSIRCDIRLRRHFCDSAFGWRVRNTLLFAFDTGLPCKEIGLPQREIGLPHREIGLPP